jgi:hypothetical protein
MSVLKVSGFCRKGNAIKMAPSTGPSYTEYAVVFDKIFVCETMDTQNWESGLVNPIHFINSIM